MKRDSALDVAVLVVVLEVIFILMTGGVFVVLWPLWLLIPIVVFFLVSYWEENETKGGTDVRK